MTNNKHKIRMLQFVWHHPGAVVILRGGWNWPNWVGITMNRSGPFFELYVPIQENVGPFFQYEYIVDGMCRVDDMYPTMPGTMPGTEGRHVNYAYIPPDSPSFLPGSCLGFIPRQELIRATEAIQGVPWTADPAEDFFHAIMLYNEPSLSKITQATLCFRCAAAPGDCGFGLLHKEDFLRLAILLWEQADSERPGCLDSAMRRRLVKARYALRYNSRPGHACFVAQTKHVLTLESQIRQLGAQPWPSPLINYLVDQQGGQQYSLFTPLNLSMAPTTVPAQSYTLPAPQNLAMPMPAVPVPAQPYTLFTPQDLTLPMPETPVPAPQVLCSSPFPQQGLGEPFPTHPVEVFSPDSAIDEVTGREAGILDGVDIEPCVYTDYTEEQLMDMVMGRRTTVTQVPRMVLSWEEVTTKESVEEGAAAPKAESVKVEEV